jgi:hypothetical protein
MTEIERITAKVEMLEARCIYLGIVCSAMLHAMPNKNELLMRLKEEVQMNDANSLYATSLSDRQQQAVQAALEGVENMLTTMRRSPDQQDKD